MKLHLPHIESGNPLQSKLLFIHGLAETSLIWTPAIDLLKNDFHCIQVDLPGHGKAWREEGSFTTHFYAQQIRQLIELKQWKSITIVAHSMGAQISCILALEIQPLIDQLIFFAPAGIETFTPDESAALIAWTDRTYNLNLPMEQLQAAFSTHLTATTPQTQKFLYDLLSFYQTDRISAFRKMITASVRGMLNEPVHANLPLIQQPVTVVIGANDRLVPNRNLHPHLQPNDILLEAKRQLRNCTIQLIENAGHFLPYEQPDMIKRIVKSACSI